jgi:hypothetical protein
VVMFGAWLAALAGAWFAVGVTLSPLWTTGAASAIGSPIGGTVHRATEQIGFFTGLGVVIAFLAALVIGRLSVIGVRDARLAESRGAQQVAARDATLAEERRLAEEDSRPVGASSAVDGPGSTDVRDSALDDPAAGPAVDEPAASERTGAVS